MAMLRIPAINILFDGCPVLIDALLRMGGYLCPILPSSRSRLTNWSKKDDVSASRIPGSRAEGAWHDDPAPGVVLRQVPSSTVPILRR